MPVIVTAVLAATAVVVIGKVAVVEPAATVTLAGTVAAVLLLDSVTVAPPVGAAPLRVTVPVEGLPPVTLVGFTATEDKEVPDVEPACNSTQADCAHTLAPRLARIITRVAVGAVFSMKASPMFVVPPEVTVA